MKNYLSIGDLAKIKCVSVKALRYYEKIGILKPAYINPDNGYRYYSPEQIIIVDFIISFLELNVPLKNFKDYIQNDTLNFKKLLDDSNILINNELEKLHAIKKRITNISSHLQDSIDRMEEQYYKGHFSERCLLITKLKKPALFDKEYIKEISRLYFLIKEKDYIPLYQNGCLYIKSTNALYAFAEIEKPLTLPENIFLLPADTFNCSIHKNNSTFDIKDFLSSDYQYVLFVERWLPYANEKNIFVEVQTLSAEK